MGDNRTIIFKSSGKPIGCIQGISVGGFNYFFERKVQMNSNIEVINENLWAVNQYYVKNIFTYLHIISLVNTFLALSCTEHLNPMHFR